MEPPSAGGVTILLPRKVGDDFKELYASGERAQLLLEQLGTDELDLYARLQFSTDAVGQTHAEFFERTYAVLKSPPSALTLASTLPPLAPAVEVHHQEAEGKVILLFSKFAVDVGG